MKGFIMNTAEYPQIGTSVSYLRADDDGQVHQGNGIVQAVFLDPNKRIQAQVRDGEEAWNVDLFCINPNDDTRKAYAKLIKEVQGLTDEGNKLVQKTVSEYNDKVKAAYDAVIGEPVSFPEPQGEPLLEALGNEEAV